MDRDGEGTLVGGRVKTRTGVGPIVATGRGDRTTTS